ncbi:MAG: hypothetical protein CMJ31_05610 [Phycisphaerae bacterium]|nr:hypothetical protein [Phycisphaerae bacterium]
MAMPARVSDTNRARNVERLTGGSVADRTDVTQVSDENLDGVTGLSFPFPLSMSDLPVDDHGLETPPPGQVLRIVDDA